MDDQSTVKQKNLLKAREEAYGWIDKERQADTFTNFHDTWMKLKINDMVSGKFENDHNAYLLALGEYRAHKRALDAIQTAPDRAGRATKELEELQAEVEANG